MTRAVLLLCALGLAVSGCRPRSGAASLGEVALVAPWDAMSLPIGTGTVWSCNAARIKIVYDGGDKSKLGDDYGRAVAEHGWTTQQPAAGSLHEWIGRYERASETLILEIHDADFNGKVPNGVEVYISIRAS